MQIEKRYLAWRTPERDVKGELDMLKDVRQWKRQAERVLELVDASSDSERAILITRANAAEVLETMPTPAVILDTDRRIVASNGPFRKQLGVNSAELIEGMRAGEALTCVHANETPGGCGSAPHCGHCGHLMAIQEARRTQKQAVVESTIQTRQAEKGGALEYRIQATPISISGSTYTVLGFEDVHSERRRRTLERTLFEDLRSACDAMARVSVQLQAPELSKSQRAEHAETLARLVHGATDHIEAQHQLYLAELGELDVVDAEVPLRSLMADLVTFHQHLSVAAGKTLVTDPVPDSTCRSNWKILRRVLNQLVVNALEATQVGGTITLTCTQMEGETKFAVQNEGVIRRADRVRIFKRAHSTKPGAGRGVGLHYAKMLVDFYLCGQIRFTSDEERGTVFEVVL